MENNKRFEELEDTCGWIQGIITRMDILESKTARLMMDKNNDPVFRQEIIELRADLKGVENGLRRARRKIWKMLEPTTDSIEG